VAAGLEVHQGRLREAHEGARGGPEHDEAGEQPCEARGGGGDREPGDEGNAAGEDEEPAAAGVGEQSKGGFEGRGKQAREGKEQTDFGVANAEVSANDRPGGLAEAEDELVNGLDQEEEDEQVQCPAQEPGPGSAGHRPKV
jgi:hypothetical protein